LRRISIMAAVPAVRFVLMGRSHDVGVSVL
jgi:hypothetical protein